MIYWPPNNVAIRTKKVYSKIRLDSASAGPCHSKDNEPVKSRHPGESRGPVFHNASRSLDTGESRYDVSGESSIFYKAVKDG